MILAEYKCGCTWAGEAGNDAADQCPKHHAEKRKSMIIATSTPIESGWCWELEQEKKYA